MLSATAAFFAGATVLFLLSCNGGSEAPASTVQPTTAPTSASVEPTPSSGVLVVEASAPVAFAFTPDGRLFFTELGTGEIRIASESALSTSVEAAASQAVNLALSEYAQLTGAELSDVELLSVTARQWPDTCLGLGELAEVCAEVVTPGYQITVTISDSSGAAVYRTDAGTIARLEKLQAVTIAGSDLFASVDVFQRSECGLLGIAIDPEFETNHYVYIYVTQPVAGDASVAKPRVIRFTDVDGTGTEPTVIVGDLPLTNPKTCAHVGGNLHFGPDGYLYLSIGNNERNEEAVAADLSSPLGKILRLNKEDGSAAPRNPFEGDPSADPRVYAYGLRNSFDFAFHPVTGEIYAPDNGPGNCDELNLIKAGGDYGVPGSLPRANTESCLGLGGIDPIHLFTRVGMRAEEFGSNMAPAGVAYLEGNVYPTLADGLLVCLFNPDILQLVELAPPNFDSVQRTVDIADCELNVEVWEGKIYYSRSNGIYVLPPEALVP
ncbi:MAG: PQQ-dependent sugar dehydrogenase [Chloroflexi bacterium]|nr:PQQ-dependent sugar dehydrogenase [Chloroflexota bacterium]